MAAGVECQDAVAGGERARLVVPGAGVARDPVEEHDRGGGGGAPVQEMKPLTMQHERSIVVDNGL